MGGFKCKKCNTNYALKKYYDHHVAHNHDGLRFECKECGRGFRTPKKRDCHLEADHSTEDEPGNVDEDGGFKKAEKAPFAANELMDHPLSHRMRPPYRCNPCGIDFKDEQKLREHKEECPRSHWLECEFCDKAFLKHKDLNKHAHLKHRLAPNWKLNKVEVFVSNWADEITVMEHRKMGGTIVFNHHKPPSADKFLRELGERAVSDDRDVDVPCAWGKFKGIFDTSQPTHDGAAVVNFFEDGKFAPRLYSTGNKLPMTAPNGQLHNVPELKGRGTRHYAAYYASLRTDALIVVVSEESATRGERATTTFLRGAIERGVTCTPKESSRRMAFNTFIIISAKSDVNMQFCGHQ